MALTNYLEALPRAEVENYLKLDAATATADQAEIEQMIEAALEFLETKLNILFYRRASKLYLLDKNYCARVYDFPINAVNTLVLDTDYTAEEKTLYTNYKVFDTTLKKIDLDVGYNDRADIPRKFLQAAKQMIKVWYFEAEKQENTTLIPESVKQVIASSRRF